VIRDQLRCESAPGLPVQVHVERRREDGATEEGFGREEQHVGDQEQGHGTYERLPSPLQEGGSQFSGTEDEVAEAKQQLVIHVGERFEGMLEQSMKRELSGT
jgi:hypothetical protein